MQVLSLESTRMAYYGSETNISQMLSVEPNAGPIVVDSIERRAYWYEGNSSLILSQPLGIGGRVQVRTSVLLLLYIL